jgi:hypothetical protein
MVFYQLVEIIEGSSIERVVVPSPYPYMVFLARDGYP